MTPEEEAYEAPRLTMFLLAAFPAHQIATEVNRISQK
jgi:hypothetical protein